MFGRLADGVSVDRARAELVTLGRRRAAAHPDTHAHLRPQIMPYTLPFFDIDQPWMAWLIRVAQLGVGLLLVVVSVNVAILVYARTATRTGEIAVRSALGASRRRVVTQLLAEALVLSALASAIGLSLASLALEAVQDFQEGEVDWAMPFWVDLGLTPGLVAYAVGLAVLAGVIVGVVPALRATGRNVQAGLRQVASGGSRMQLGRTWTALIVVQVAIAVAALPYAVYASGQSVLHATAPPGYATDAFLRASLSMEREEAPPRADAAAYEEAIRTRFLESAAELLRRLEAEPSVAGVAFASGFPGSERFGRIEVQGTDVGRYVRVNRVDVDFFAVFDVPVLAGRGFTDSDAAPGGNAVVVDRVFSETVLGGGEALGRWVRDLTRTASGETEEGPWLEVVGVVPGLGVNPSNFGPPGPRLYQPVALADAPAGLALAVRMRDGVLPASFTGRLRDISAAVDPALQLHQLRTATAAERERQRAFLGFAAMIVAITLSVLLLSAAGVYAMMSFTVARRRREIGIRTALGAAPRRLLASIFVRSGAQLGGGVLAGLVVAAALDRAMGGGPLAGKGMLLLPLVAGFMVLVGLLAAVGPARRGLAVQPTEALREE
jgi:predicted permease